MNILIYIPLSTYSSKYKVCIKYLDVELFSQSLYTYLILKSIIKLTFKEL